MKDFLSTINRLSPTKCRLLAVKGRTPVSSAELAQRSGLHPSTIKVLARSDSWESFKVSTIIKFTKACGVDLLHQKRALWKLRRMLESAHGPPHIRSENRRYWASVFAGEKGWRRQQP